MSADSGLVEIGEGMTLVRALRLGMGLTGTQMVYRCGIDRTRLSFIERGLEPPRPREREQLARALKVAPDQVDKRVRLFVQMPPREVEAAAQQPTRQRRQRAGSKGIAAEQ
jgi:transcriptional regulator with XRE-family HTH domain